MSARVVILGAGSWGSALAAALSSAHQVALWARGAEHRAQLARDRGSRYNERVRLPPSVEVIPESPDAALANADLVLVATPVAGLRECVRLHRRTSASAPLVWACKGFEPSTGALAHEVVEEEAASRASWAALSGPSFALEVARGLPTALVLASKDTGLARELAQSLHQQRLRVYFTDDVVGVEIGGAVKNVIAIATGISDGLGLGNNARAALITRGLAEISRLGRALGGREDTFLGLAGAGDLVLTCTSELSRNRRVGLALAAGEGLDAILERLGETAEGVGSAPCVLATARTRGVDMPITESVARVLNGELEPARAAETLLAREPKSESAR